MSKNRWSRIPFSEIKDDEKLLSDMRLRRRTGGAWWPYRCGSEIRWKII